MDPIVQMNNETIEQRLHKALSELPALYSKDGTKGDLPAVYIFTPDAGGTWILWEYDPKEKLAYGMCDLGFPECGSVYIPELAAVRGGFGLPVEIDKSLTTRFDGMKNAGIDIPDWMKS